MLDRKEAIRIINGMVAVDLEGTTPCDSVGCDRRICVLQTTGQEVLDKDFDPYAWSNLLAFSRMPYLIEHCPFPAIQELAKELIEKTS